MCGQVGFILGKKKRSAEDWTEITRNFLYLMVYSETQGPHATGMAMIRDDGSFSLFKRPGRAHRIIVKPEFIKALGKLDSRATLLMGHTRYRTRGSEKRNRNNHPLRAGSVLGTHNGTILNADELFTEFDLPRYTEVDSELLVRLADHHSEGGPIAINGLLERISRCRGQISAIISTIQDPERVLVFKGNRPLTLWYHKEKRIIAYASQEKWLEVALEEQMDWVPIDIDPMSLLIFHRSRLGRPKRHKLNFEAHENSPKGAKNAKST